MSAKDLNTNDHGSMDGNSSDLDDREFLTALKPVRPDWTTFESEVQRRIEDRKNGGSTRGDGAGGSSPAGPRIVRDDQAWWARVAAGILPPGALEIPGIATASAKGTAKATLATIIALPSISVLMLLVAFLGTIRSLGSRRALKADTENAHRLRPEDYRMWWRQHRGMIFLGYVILLSLSVFLKEQALFLAFLLSMLGLVQLVRHLSRLGIADRFNVGQPCSTMLIFLGIFAQTTRGGLLDSYTHLALITGGTLCMLVTPHPTRSMRWLPKVAAVPFVAFMLWNGWQATTPSVGDSRAWIESFDGETENSASWRNWSTAARTFRDLDRSFDPSSQRAALLERQARKPLNPYIQVLALESGILTLGEAGRLDDVRLRSFIIDAEPEIPDPEEALAWILPMASPLSQSDRQVVISRLLASWPRVGDYRGLRTARLIIDGLVALGADEEVDALGPKVEELLFFFHRPTEREGGFSNLPTGRRSDLDATYNAILLMERFGAPKNLDLEQVWTYLEVESKEAWLGQSHSDPAYQAQAIQDRLEVLVGYSPPTFWEQLTQSRYFVGALLVALLALYVTMRAPRVRSQPA